MYKIITRQSVCTNIVLSDQMFPPSLLHHPPPPGIDKSMLITLIYQAGIRKSISKIGSLVLYLK